MKWSGVWSGFPAHLPSCRIRRLSVYPKEKQLRERHLCPRPTADSARRINSYIARGQRRWINRGSKTGSAGSLLSWIQNWLSSRIAARASPAAAGTGCLLLDGKHAARLPNCRYQLERILRADGRTLVSRNDGPDDAAEDRSKWARTSTIRSPVQSRVVRWGSDGLGLAYVLSKAVDPNNGESLRENGADRKTLERFLETAERRRRGVTRRRAIASTEVCIYTLRTFATRNGPEIGHPLQSMSR